MGIKHGKNKYIYIPPPPPPPPPPHPPPPPPPHPPPPHPPPPPHRWSRCKIIEISTVDDNEWFDNNNYDDYNL